MQEEAFKWEKEETLRLLQRITLETKHGKGGKG
jgi:hypothetical protein